MSGTGLTTRGELEVDLAAIRHNYRALKEHSAPGRCAAVIKADAYGAGAVSIARALGQEGCRVFFVADAREGVALRQEMHDAEIMLLDGLSDTDLPAVKEAGLIPVLNSPRQHQRWQAAGGGPTVWQVDSGMNRLGMAKAEAEALAGEDRPPDLLLTHFSCADEIDKTAHAQQLKHIAELRAAFPDVSMSLGNTAGIQLGAAGRSSLSRCGIGLFGVNPASANPGPGVMLKSAVRLRARVLQHRSIPAGTPVGYGATWYAEDACHLLTVALGYADGIPRRLGNRGSATFDGTALPMVGRVSMDYLTLDASGLEARQREDARWVDLFADATALDRLASEADTISYELLARLGPRIRRRYLT
ncbi:MAG: alanine racemase [Pseudomonadota bacterium]